VTGKILAFLVPKLRLGTLFPEALLPFFGIGCRRARQELRESVFPRRPWEQGNPSVPRTQAPLESVREFRAAKMWVGRRLAYHEGGCPRLSRMLRGRVP
jgi:hypothetical protein